MRENQSLCVRITPKMPATRTIHADNGTALRLLLFYQSMKPVSIRHTRRASTMTDVLIVVVTIVLLVGVLLPRLARPRSHIKSVRIHCVVNQKQIGLALRIWAFDNNDQFPWMTSTNGGTAEFANSTNVFLHFLTASNELGTPQILACKADTARTQTADWNTFRNQNLSYFVGLTAEESNPQSILSGDRNLTTNGTPLGHGVFNIATTNQPGWSKTIHQSAGNVGLADGSVQQVSIAALQKQWQSYTNLSSTNLQRIAIP